MNLTNVGSTIINGALINYGPSVLKGVMKEYLGMIVFSEMVDWVNKDRNLWDELPDNYKKILKTYGVRLGKLEWLNVEWIIEAGQTSNPGIASLFIGWEEGREWLNRQLENMKEQIGVKNE
jgi:hypothetical protein